MLLSSSSSSSEQQKTGTELPPLSEILDLTPEASSKWCSKLGLATGTKKANQIALIECVSAKQSTVTSKLAFDKSATTFTWTFSKDELKKCDTARKNGFLESAQFTDKNGIEWCLRFYPKGEVDSEAAETALFLVPVNLETAGVVNIRVNFTLWHLQSEATRGVTVAMDSHSHGFGWPDFMDMPGIALSQCPICLQNVGEKLATECGHAFCAKCTVRMLTDSAQIKCPLCRRSVARSDDLVSVRYSALETFALKVKVSTVELDKNMGATATLGDVMYMSQAIESKLDAKLSKISEQISLLRQPVSGSKRTFSEMKAE